MSSGPNREAHIEPEPAGEACEDEPMLVLTMTADPSRVVVFRALDSDAPRLADTWADVAEERGAAALAADARATARAMRVWQDKRGITRNDATPYPRLRSFMEMVLAALYAAGKVPES